MMDNGSLTGFDGASASRLIADATAKNDILSVLFEPIVGVFDCGLKYVSIDDVVFTLRFKTEDDAANLNSLCSIMQCDDVPVTSETNEANKFRFMWSFKLGESSVRLFIGFNETGGRIDMTRGKLQFNPNKCGGDPRLGMLLKRVGAHLKTSELKRYDVAIDVPINREDCRLFREDHRQGYDFMDHGNGQTEYLGTRNKAGRVKLYDKTREAGLSEPWTRLELTCAGDWKTETILKRIPKVWSLPSGVDESSKPWVRVVARMARFLIFAGEPLEPYLSGLTRYRRKILEACHAVPAVELSADEARMISDRAHAWGSMLG